MEPFTDGTGKDIWVHEEYICNGNCPIHNPSDHTLKHLPLIWNQKESLFERILLTGERIPDPDSLAYRDEHRNAVLCLICDTVIESKSRWNYVTCPCGNVSVDGGQAYKRRSFKTTQFQEL